MTSVNNFRNRTAVRPVKIGALLLLAISATTPLFAQGTVVEGKAKSSNVVEERVPYSDLNLMHEQNQVILISRVKKAANKVCDIIYRGQHPMMKFESRCNQTTFRDAKPQIDLAIANAQNGTRVAIKISPPRSR